MLHRLFVFIGNILKWASQGGSTSLIFQKPVDDDETNGKVGKHNNAAFFVLL